MRKGRFSQARKREENNKEFTTTPKLSPQGQELQVQTPSHPQTPLQGPLESPRHLVWLFLQDPARLREADQLMLSFIRQEHVVDLAYILTQQFVYLLWEHRVEELDTWLSTCTSSGLSELETFASGLPLACCATASCTRRQLLPLCTKAADEPSVKTQNSVSIRATHREAKVHL